jgi:hypothetical protein
LENRALVFPQSQVLTLTALINAHRKRGEEVTEMSGAKPLKDLGPSPAPTPALSRTGRKVAEAIMEAAQFKPNADGSRFVRQYEVHGIEVTEWISAEKYAEMKHGNP